MAARPHSKRKRAGRYAPFDEEGALEGRAPGGVFETRFGAITLGKRCVSAARQGVE